MPENSREPVSERKRNQGRILSKFGWLHQIHKCTLCTNHNKDMKTNVPPSLRGLESSKKKKKQGVIF